MDGVVDTGDSPDQQVYVIGVADSTALDPALLRQGRLGLHVRVPPVSADELRAVYDALEPLCAPGVLAEREVFEERIEAAGDEILGCDAADLLCAASE